MTLPRYKQISLEDTEYYHCISRCVRRAFLLDEDQDDKEEPGHRRQWVVDRLRFLSDIFAIDICAYAVLSSHYHVILRVNKVLAQEWSHHEVIERWCCMFNGTPLSQRYLKGESLSAAEQDVLEKQVAIWRERLMSISWFMKQLNEWTAREANKEDGCKGRFWEGRFKSQALLDTAALLACMVYVDLNPVRAGIADSVEASDFTSVQERLFEVARQQQSQKPEKAPPKTNLLPFIESEHKNRSQAALPFNIQDYLDLVDWTGRAVREDKRGSIAPGKPRLLEQLHMTEKQWMLLAIDIQQLSFSALGALAQLEIYHATINKRWMPRQKRLRECYEKAA